MLYPLRETGILQCEGVSNTWLLGMVIAGIAISTLLSTPFVQRVFRALIEPRPRWLFSEASQRGDGAQRLVQTDPLGQGEGESERDHSEHRTDRE